MRIAYDDQAFSLQPYGGISRYYSQLAKQVYLDGEDVLICAPLHRNQHIKDLPSEIVSGRHIKSYPPLTLDMARSLNQVLSKPVIQNWQPNLIHETYYSRHGAVSESCPTVITVHDMIHELFPNSFASNEKTTQLKKSAISRADHIICVSKNTQADLLNLFHVDSAKTSVIHLGFDFFGDHHDSNQAESFSVDQKKPYLLFVGDRKGYKNFFSFLKAVIQSSRLSQDFDVIAFGGGRFTRAEKLLVNTLGFRPGQVLHRQGSDQDLRRLYREAKAFIYPSLYEGFGLPPLEAMAHSCPVISSNTSSMPEVIGDAAKYFNPTSVEDLSLAIEKVVYDDQYADQLVTLGHDQVKKYSWSRCAKQTLAVYRQLA